MLFCLFHLQYFRAVFNKAIRPTFPPSHLGNLGQSVVLCDASDICSDTEAGTGHADFDDKANFEISSE